jgi:hypothetical protein
MSKRTVRSRCVPFLVFIFVYVHPSGQIRILFIMASIFTHNNLLLTGTKERHPSHQCYLLLTISTYVRWSDGTNLASIEIRVLAHLELDIRATTGAGADITRTSKCYSKLGVLC